MRVICKDKDTKPYKVIRNSDQAISKESFWTQKSARGAHLKESDILFRVMTIMSEQQRAIPCKDRDNDDRGGSTVARERYAKRMAKTLLNEGR